MLPGESLDQTLIAKMPTEDAFYALRSSEEKQRRQEMMNLDHMKPLLKLLDQIRQENQCTPNFDPCDGGVEAKVLFLLEAPGRQAKGSGFVSRNNPDQTAKNMWRFLTPLRRRDVILWNIVPWYLGTEKRILPAKRPDISAARCFLKELLDLLKDLKFIVLMGRAARSEREKIDDMLAIDRKVRIRETMHPSLRVLNSRPSERNVIDSVIFDIGSEIC